MKPSTPVTPQQPPEKSPHILGTSANLLGFMFLVLTLTKSWSENGPRLVEKATGATVILLTLSTLTAFLSMHIHQPKLATFSRRTAELSFLLALFLCFIIACLVVFDVVDLDR